MTNTSSTLQVRKTPFQYLSLLGNLVSRELKKKHRRSILGYVWCVLNPLLVMLIMNMVFSHMFRNNIENYPVYLFVGRTIFSFITDSTNSTSRSIIGNGALMRKTKIPYYIFPTATFLSSVVNYLFSLIAFIIVLLLTNTPVTIHAIAFPLVMLQLFVFSYGLGLLLSQLNTFARDVGQIYTVFTTAWMYLTPLFYPLENLPDFLQNIIKTCNPAYVYIQQGRLIFLGNTWPTGDLILQGSIFALVFLGLGILAYHKCNKKLILYV